MEEKLDLKENKVDGKVVKVAYINDINQRNMGGNKLYSYQKSLVDVEIGDTVIADTRFGCSLARVYAIEDREENTSQGSIILANVTGKVDIFVAAKLELREKALKKKMEQKMAKVEEQMKYKLYAAQDDEFRKLYEELYGKLD